MWLRYKLKKLEFPLELWKLILKRRDTDKHDGWNYQGSKEGTRGQLGYWRWNWITMCVWHLREQETQSPSEERNMESLEFFVGRPQKICVHGKLLDCSKLFALLLYSKTLLLNSCVVNGQWIAWRFVSFFGIVIIIILNSTTTCLCLQLSH